MLPEKGGPLGEEDLIVLALIVQKKDTEKEGQSQGEKGREQRSAMDALMSEKKEGEEKKQTENEPCDGAAPQAEGGGGKKEQSQKKKPTCGPDILEMKGFVHGEFLRNNKKSPDMTGRIRHYDIDKNRGKWYTKSLLYLTGAFDGYSPIVSAV